MVGAWSYRRWSHDEREKQTFNYYGNRQSACGPVFWDEAMAEMVIEDDGYEGLDETITALIKENGYEWCFKQGEEN